MLGYLFGFGSIPRYEPTANPTPGKNIFPDSNAIEMERRIENLELACAGLWHLLKHHHGYTDEQLVLAVQAVDEMDGVRDGKITKRLANCPHCGRQLLTRARNRCAWCGADLPAQPFTGA
ncbi:MAG: hypothetical protein KF784_01855 [Fimbriimonadaceae bacterium]|nr:hypothetical protein [Fimbriimonadaceae bacterium]